MKKKTATNVGDGVIYRGRKEYEDKTDLRVIKDNIKNKRYSGLIIKQVSI